MKRGPKPKPASQLTDAQITDRMVGKIVSSLQSFGYPAADEKNVFTDYVYSRVFRQQLVEGLASVDRDSHPLLAGIIESLIVKIDSSVISP